MKATEEDCFFKNKKNLMLLKKDLLMYGMILKVNTKKNF
jgi:hypothetical protein